MSRSKTQRIVATKSLDWMVEAGKTRCGLYISVRKSKMPLTADEQWYLYTAIASLVLDAGIPVPPLLAEAIGQMRDSETRRLHRAGKEGA